MPLRRRSIQVFHTGSRVITVEALNRLLLDLYRASRELAMKEFQLRTLELIRPHYSVRFGLVGDGNRDRSRMQSHS